MVKNGRNLSDQFLNSPNYIITITFLGECKLNKAGSWFYIIPDI